LNLINRYEKNNWSFGLLPFHFCKGKSWYVTKSKEIITMELQNELEVATFAGGCFGVQKQYFF
jgi:peptide-methionine (S)-S-oxide reductase